MDYKDEYIDVLNKYTWALRYVQDTVLDIYCGKGHGTSILAEVTQEAIGVDPTEEYIKCAKRRYFARGLSYLVKDYEDIFKLGQFDTVIFWGVEILEGDWKREIVDIFNRVVYKTGDLIFSVPFRYAKEAKSYFIGFKAKYFRCIGGTTTELNVNDSNAFDKTDGELIVILGKEKFNWLERIKL